jgi:signal recognition particle subunit SRP54
MKDQLENFDERELVRTEAIIQSMTPAERQNTKLLNGSRRLRIAKGSGMTVTDVNQLVARFEQAAKMMKTVAKGGMPQMPGMGPIPGAHGGKKAGAKKKGKGGSRSGNPAKRAAENAALAQGVKPGGASGGGSGFGLGGGGSTQQAPSEEELAALQKLLGRR